MRVYGVIFFVSCLLYSCSKESLDVGNTSEPIKTRSVTQRISPVFNWEDTAYVVLPGISGLTTLPWYSGAATQIPDFILKDYNSKDGWELIYNFCTDPVEAQIKKSYLMFYNCFTGILRVFYYNVNNTTTAGTTFWKFSLNRPSAMLNSIGAISEPMSVVKTNPMVYLTNITDVPAKSLAAGWNCFDVELCYDNTIQNANTHMNIGVFDYLSSNINLQGNLSLSSAGTIVNSAVSQSTDTKDIVMKGVKLAGDFAKEFLSKKLEKSSWKEGSTKAIGAATVATLIAKGVQLLGGAFHGRKADHDSAYIRISTDGTLQLTGNIESVQQSNVSPIANLLLPGTPASSTDNYLPSFSQALGVWNIESDPVVYLSSEVALCLSDMSPSLIQWICDSSQPFSKRISYHLESSIYFDPSSVKVVINPDVLEKVNKYEINTNFIYYMKTTNGAGIRMGDPDYSGMRGDIFYYDDSICLVQSIGKRFICNSPTRVDPFFKGFARDMLNRKYFKENTGWGKTFIEDMQVKVTVTLYPKAPYNETPLVMTRSFKPKLGGYKGKP